MAGPSSELVLRLPQLVQYEPANRGGRDLSEVRAMIIFAVKRPVKVVGKPCAGKLHARFDEGLLGRRNIKPVTYSMSGLKAAQYLAGESPAAAIIGLAV